MRKLTLNFISFVDSFLGKTNVNEKINVQQIPLNERFTEEEWNLLVQFMKHRLEKEESISFKQLASLKLPVKELEKETAKTIEVADNQSTKSKFVKKEKPAPEKKESMMGRVLKELVVFVKTHYQLRYNELTSMTEIGTTQLRGEQTEVIYVPMTERDINSICVEAQLSGINCWDKDVKRLVNSNQVKNFHPFKNYMEELPAWDGVDRLPALAQRVSDNPLWSRVLHVWMRGVVAQWMQIDNNQKGLKHGHALAPILISKQQGWGKSTFCQMLLPDALRDYYTDSFDLNNPNVCLKTMATCGLINMDEFDHISRSKIADLKTLMQKSVLRYKIGNQKSMTKAERLASFIGTTNRPDVMTDPTGSRRFFCVELEHPIDCETPIEYEQLYAQLKEELLAGQQPWLDQQTALEVCQHNKQYYRSSTEEEALLSSFRFVEKGTAGSMLLSASRIYEILAKEHSAVMRNSNFKHFTHLLPLYQQHIHTNQGNMYCVMRVE